MKTWKHINFEQRKTIHSCISHKYKLIDIANLLNLDPTSISKEVKRNRFVDKPGASKDLCPKLNRCLLFALIVINDILPIVFIININTNLKLLKNTLMLD